MKTILPFLLLGLWTSTLFSQNGLPPNAGARGIAMGNASINFRDINSAFSNQAGLAFLDEVAFTVGGEQRFLLNEIRSVTAAAALPSSSGTFGLSLHYFGFAEYNEQRIGLAYARKLTDGLALGAQFDFLNTRIPEYGSKGLVTFEVGLLAAITDQVSLATHIFSPVRIQVLEGEYLPTMFKFGLGYRPSSNVLLSGEVEKDLLYPARFKAGLEYALLDAFLIRLGAGTQPSLASFGFGLRLANGLCIDGASQYHLSLGWTPAFSLTYQL